METSFKERLRRFEEFLTVDDENEEANDGKRTSIMDMKLFRETCLYGIPDEGGLRPRAWKVLLGYLPQEKQQWRTTLLTHRLSYYNWVQDLLDIPSDLHPTSDHPLNMEAGSQWANYFGDNTILEQIDKDVRRTLPELAFFQQKVPYNALNPLSPPPLPELEEAVDPSNGKPPRRFSFGLGRPRSASTASKKSKRTVDTRSRSNSRSSARSFSSGILEGTEFMHSPRKMVRKLSSAFSKSSTSLAQTSKKKHSNRNSKPIHPAIKNRRTLFERLAHLNSDSGSRFRGDAENGESRASEPDVPDCHWEVIKRILFIYAKLNPGVGYVQGMNELLAPLYYVFAKDNNMEEQAHAEADAFFAFTALMSDVRDHFVRSLDHDASTGINSTMYRMSELLAWCDKSLWRDLRRKDVKEQYYAFRWLTVLCSQEWDLPDVIRLWDSILATINLEESQPDFILDFTVAMVICIRQELLEGDFAENVRLLQNYPIDDIHIVLNKAYEIRDRRLAAMSNGLLSHSDKSGGLLQSDWSDSASLSSMESSNRLQQRLRQTTENARASLDSFRQGSKDSMDEIFKKGLAIAKKEEGEIKQRIKSNLNRNLSGRFSGVNILINKMNRSRSTQSSDASIPTTNYSDITNNKLHRTPSTASQCSRQSTSTSRSSLLNRFSQIMVSNTSITPYERARQKEQEQALATAAVDEKIENPTVNSTCDPLSTGH